MRQFFPFANRPSIKFEDSNSNLLPFVSLKSIFSPTELEVINSLWSDTESSEGTLATGGVNYERRKTREVFIDFEANNWIYRKIEQTISLINAVTYKFDITGFSGRIRLLKYSTSDFFDWHMDYSAANCNIKLVLCMQLSDSIDYVGGDLQLIAETLAASREKGSAVIFPSYLLHRVTPVNAGCRMSLVATIAGPSFR